MLTGKKMTEKLAKADLYLLMNIDLDFTQDGTRYFPNTESRQKFFHICRDILIENECRYEIVSGSGQDRLAAGYRALQDERLTTMTATPLTQEELREIVAVIDGLLTRDPAFNFRRIGKVRDRLINLHDAMVDEAERQTTMNGGPTP